MPEDSTIQKLDLDIRPEIQAAYIDCYEDIIEYNLYQSIMGDQYGATFKTKFYRDFQRVYFLSKPAFAEKRAKDKDLDDLLKQIDSWINCNKKESCPSGNNMDTGHGLFMRLEPFLFKRNLVVIADGVSGE